MANGEIHRSVHSMGPQVHFSYGGPGSTTDSSTGVCTYANYPIPAGITVIAVRGCGGGGGGSAGDNSGGSQYPGYGGGGGGGALFQTIGGISVNGGADTVTVTIKPGGKGGLPNGNAGSEGGETVVNFSNSPHPFVFRGAPGAPHCKSGGGPASPWSTQGGGNASGGKLGLAGSGSPTAPGGAGGHYFPGALPNHNYGGCGGGGGAGYGPGFPGGSGGRNEGENIAQYHSGSPGFGWDPSQTNWGAGGGGGGGGGDGYDFISGGPGGDGAPGYVELWW